MILVRRCQGYLVIDNNVRGPRKGGVRMQPSLKIEDILRLAHTLTWKNAAADDRLPERLLREDMEDGQGITEAEMEAPSQDYYRLKGWSEAGIPQELDA